MISTGKLIYQIFMKFHNWFSYFNVAEFQDVNHAAYEMYKCPLWIESRHSQFLLLEKSFAPKLGKGKKKGLLSNQLENRLLREEKIMKGYLKALVGFLILFSTPVFSGEVTDKEWIPILDVLIVTYYHDGEYSEVECIALNQQGKPIGGGSGHPVAGIARVPIYVPTKYVKTDLKVSCK